MSNKPHCLYNNMSYSTNTKKRQDRYRQIVHGNTVTKSIKYS